MHKYFGDTHTLEKKMCAYDYMTKRAVNTPADLEYEMHRCLEGYTWNGINLCRFATKKPIAIEGIVLAEGKDHFLLHGLRSMVFSYEGKNYKVFMYNFDKANSSLNGRPESVRLEGQLVGALLIPEIAPYHREHRLCPVIYPQKIDKVNNEIKN